MPKSGAGLRIKHGFNWVVRPLLMKLYLAGALAVGRGRACGQCRWVWRHLQRGCTGPPPEEGVKGVKDA